jgi:2,4-dienoyl-CoA reductase (NADPH2)
MARTLIADPDMPRKLLAGRAADVRPCVACNEDCRAFDPILLCSVNPELGPPGADRRPAAPLVVRRGRAGPGRVAIVGRGRPAWNAPSHWPAIARSCCSRPRGDRRAARGRGRCAQPPWVGALLDFYARRLEQVDLRLGSPVDSHDLGDFDEVVIAVGATRSFGPCQASSARCRRRPRSVSR